MDSPLLHTARRVRTAVADEVDVAVVGCGLGGLQAAALLAQAGLRVACFDHHYVAGGCATMFERGRSDARWRFDVGLHYIGDCGEDGAIPRLLAEAGVRDVAFAPMDPDGFDTLVFPGLTFRIPVGLEHYRERLVATFPRERRGIDRYCRFLSEVDHLASQLGGRKGWAMALQVVLHGRLAARYRQATIQQVLDDCTRDKALQAVMLGQSGDYGVAPSQASALLHAGLALHYFKGAYYPKGGGQVLADRLASRIEALGGSVHLRRGIDRILVESGRAVGVQIEADGKRDVQQVRARTVVSNADIHKTLLELVGPAHLPAGYVSRVRQWTMGGALWVTCLGLQGDVRELGMTNSNIWQFDDLDVEAFYTATRRSGAFTPGGCYITSATVKDGSSGHAPPGCSTLEVMTLVPASPAAWGLRAEDLANDQYRRMPAYLERKQALQENLIARVDRLLPGAAGRICLSESASPLTHTRFTRATDGTGYGLAATPAQFLQGRPGYRSPVAGLYLAGASTRAGHGIVGALNSGSQAARRIAADLGVSLG
jgi:all-trans-retinol 13,14-reductase